jgi:hypothetical protein
MSDSSSEFYLENEKKEIGISLDNNNIMIKRLTVCVFRKPEPNS